MARIVRGLAMAAVVVAWAQVPAFVRETGSKYDERPRSRLERELTPARMLELPYEAFIGTSRAIPRRAAYAVVVGDMPPVSGLQRVAIPDLMRYWLMPRVRSDDVDRVHWIVSWSHPAETLGVKVRREIGVAPGVNVVQVR